MGGVIVLDEGTAADLPGVRALLHEAGLPLEGLMTVPTHLVVARDGERIVGAGAMERHGADALLRSLVVSAEHRASGIGSGIVGELERWAAAHGIGSTYLLTDSATRFFRRRGYRRIGRDAAPQPVRDSVEWATACGASAIAMVR